MRYGITVYSAPAKLPVTLAETKNYIKVDDTVTEDDALIVGLMQAATTMAEAYLGRYLITQTVDVTYDHFPCGDYGVLYLPKAPVQSITSVSYVDENGTTQTWGASNYQLDSKQEPARLTTAYDISYPTTRAQMNAVTVRHVVGYGDNPNNVPENIRLAILLLVGEMYVNRQITVYGVSVNQVSLTADRLLAPYRIVRFD